MIQLKNAAQIEKMKEAGRITGEAIILAGEAVREGKGKGAVPGC